MQQHTETVTPPRSNGGTQPRGRKAQGGQEEVIKLAALKSSMGELVALHIKRKDAADELSEAIKAAAEISGLHATVVARFVKASAGEKFEEEKTKVEQLALVFAFAPLRPIGAP